MKKITELAKKHKLYLIEDCAQSHGSKYNNQTTGTFGDIGCFSFYPTKNIGAFGDSGAIVTNNPLLAEKIRMMRNYGSKVKYHHDIEGINSRMDEIQASILNVKLNHYKEILESRLKNVEFYLHNIHNQYIELPKVQKFSTSVFHLFVIRTKYRESLINYLKSNSISTMIHYPIPAHLTPALKFLHHKRGDFPITELIANEVLSLPLFDGITTNELSFVVKTINKFKPL
jgi:dTDP-4-amino-4,6-dideoxygalactose transaminase